MQPATKADKLHSAAVAGSWHHKTTDLNRYETAERDKAIMRAVGWMAENERGSMRAVGPNGLDLLATTGITARMVDRMKERLGTAAPSASSVSMSPILDQQKARNQGNKLLTERRS